ncbi:MAG: PadR family transcriptional regulator [Coriobacteriia bacterium]|nr:PadR family transcriptional regulator [Coriobacteriia bacterium]
MWAVCNPKTEDELNECEALGHSLSRLMQPTILTVLKKYNEPLHGYVIVQKVAESPMFGGKKPDPTGTYRTLKKMEECGYVTSEWKTPEKGSPKRVFSLTDAGERCLRRWIDALACYTYTIELLRSDASDSLGIDLPELPQCHQAAQ